MNQFLHDLGYFMMGAAIGFMWHAIWPIAKKIWAEVKQARKEW